MRFENIDAAIKHYKKFIAFYSAPLYRKSFEELLEKNQVVKQALEILEAQLSLVCADSHYTIDAFFKAYIRAIEKLPYDTSLLKNLFENTFFYEFIRSEDNRKLFNKAINAWWWDTIEAKKRIDTVFNAYKEKNNKGPELDKIVALADDLLVKHLQPFLNQPPEKFEVIFNRILSNIFIIANKEIEQTTAATKSQSTDIIPVSSSTPAHIRERLASMQKQQPITQKTLDTSKKRALTKEDQSPEQKKETRILSPERESNKLPEALAVAADQTSKKGATSPKAC